jgi:predicted RNA-binding protein with PUA-like domain
VSRGDLGEEWDGVRNYQALNFMRVMEIGDMGFFYHSLKEKSIVGIVQVIAKAHADSTTDDPGWECVDIKAVSAVGTPVKLQEIKSHPELKDMVLVNNSRLSIQPVTQAQWETVCVMARIKLQHPSRRNRKH